MPRANAPEWRRRLEPVLDDWIKASINMSNGKCDPVTGAYTTLVINDLKSEAEANEYQKALYRSAHYLHNPKRSKRRESLNCSVTAKTYPNADGTFRIEFTVFNKDHARIYVSKTYGDDHTKRPYDSRAWHMKEN